MILRAQYILSAAILAAAAVLWVATLPVARQWAGLGTAPASPGSGPAAPNPVRVIATPPRNAALERGFSAIGTVRSARSVVLASEIAGRLAQVSIAPGAHVDKGTILAVIEDEAAVIALEQAQLAAEDAARALTRFERLAGAGSATDSDRQDAASAARAAELALRAAELALDRHRITAPIAGWVGLIGPAAGDYLAQGDRITTIEDRSALFIDVRFPQAAAAALAPGDRLEVRGLTGIGVTLDAQVTAIDNRVDTASRTIALEARLTGDLAGLRPGMALRLTLNQRGDTHPAVDPLALQWGAEGAFVWILREGRAERLPVSILQRRADLVLVSADFLPADLVVSEGILQLRPGLPAEALSATQDDG